MLIEADRHRVYSEVTPYQIFFQRTELDCGQRRRQRIALFSCCSEIYLEKAFDEMRPRERLPIAKELGETSLMFVIHPTLGEQEMRDTVAAVQKVMAQAT